VRGEKKIEIAAETFDYHFTRNISLGDELSFVEVIARSSNGAKVSSRRIVRSGENIDDFVAADRKDYALLFATDKYDNWPNLINPVSDAKALAVQLKEKFNFETRIVENADQSSKQYVSIPSASSKRTISFSYFLQAMASLTMCLVKGMWSPRIQ
jgi:hypothetical protein